MVPGLRRNPHERGTVEPPKDLRTSGSSFFPLKPFTSDHGNVSSDQSLATFSLLCDVNANGNSYCNRNTYTNGNTYCNCSHNTYRYCNRNTYANRNTYCNWSYNTHPYCDSDTYANANADYNYIANGYTNWNSKHYAQAGSHTTPASYYAAAASVGLELRIADSPIADGL